MVMQEGFLYLNYMSRSLKEIKAKKLSQAQLIYQLIRENKYLSLKQVHEVAEALGCKQRTLERRLNVSEAPSWIETCYIKGCIAGYRFKKVIS